MVIHNLFEFKLNLNFLKYLHNLCEEMFYFCCLFDKRCQNYISRRRFVVEAKSGDFIGDGFL